MFSFPPRGGNNKRILMERDVFQKIKNLPELEGAYIRVRNQKERTLLRNVLIKLHWDWGGLSCEKFFPKDMAALHLGEGYLRGKIYSYMTTFHLTLFDDDKVFTVQQFLRLVRDAQAEMTK